METISFNDTYESFYHGFLTGIFLGMKGYQVRSNRESGTGRSDLAIRPVTRKKPAFVLEFKVAGKFTELEKKAEEALRQIEKRQYVRELQEDGYQKVHCYGIAFFRKDCLVRLGETQIRERPDQGFFIFEERCGQSGTGGKNGSK